MRDASTVNQNSESLVEENTPCPTFDDDTPSYFSIMWRASIHAAAGCASSARSDPLLYCMNQKCVFPTTAVVVELRRGSTRHVKCYHAGAVAGLASVVSVAADDPLR